MKDKPCSKAYKVTARGDCKDCGWARSSHAPNFDRAFRPGGYLHKLDSDDVPAFRADAEADKCTHNQGHWVVRHPADDSLWVFSPTTQLQKDIWLSEAYSPKEKEERVQLLRWFCTHTDCGTVQRP